MYYENKRFENKCFQYFHKNMNDWILGFKAIQRHWILGFKAIQRHWNL
jgi:hypothetical protein